MAVVRHGPTDCRHEPGCPHDIGPAACRVEGLAAMGRLSVMTVSEGLLVDRAQSAGCGPVERRQETPGEREARLLREAPAPAPAAAGIPMHVLRPAKRAPAPCPSPARPEEETAVPVTPAPAVPCHQCLHEPVCKLRAGLEVHLAEGARTVITAPGLRVRWGAPSVECDHLLSALPPARVAPALLRAPDPAPEPRVEVMPFPARGETQAASAAAAEFASIAAERVAASRRRGGEHLRKATDEQLLEALRAAGGNQQAASRALGLSHMTVRHRVRALASAGRLPTDVAASLTSRPGNRPRQAVTA